MLAGLPVETHEAYGASLALARALPIRLYQATDLTSQLDLYFWAMSTDADAGCTPKSRGWGDELLH